VVLHGSLTPLQPYATGILQRRNRLIVAYEPIMFIVSFALRGGRVRRRDFVAVVGSAAAWPFAVRAQPPGVPMIGYLGSESPVLFASRLRAFLEGLRTTGYDEGRNVAIEYRWAKGHNERLPVLATDLARLSVRVIAAPGSLAAALAAKAATATIPVVFETGADPIAVGLVTSLDRPGGNLTGVTSLNAQVGPKRLQLLHELLPSAAAIALLVNPTNPKNAKATTKDLEAAADSLGIKLHVLDAATESDLDAVFPKLLALKAAGLVIANETFFANRSELLAALSVRYAVPAAHQSREFVAAGGLLSYGGDTRESHSQAGVYTGRVLNGEKPADLPIQQVTKVEFVINLKTAKALGLTIPPSLLARADEVIE
jgi:putative tryptophan/tyrosine transport system substrate-binding protein